MEKNPTVRRLDDLGRIVIPDELRAELGWHAGDQLEIAVHYVSIRSILIRPEQKRCSLCCRVCDDIQPVGCGAVCPACMQAIKDR